MPGSDAEPCHRATVLPMRPLPMNPTVVMDEATRGRRR